jgi:hypothetical protein
MPPRNESALAAKRALRNKDAQRTQDESLASFLVNRNREFPNGLKCPGDGTDEQERNVRQRTRSIEQDAVDGGSVTWSTSSFQHAEITAELRILQVT